MQKVDVAVQSYRKPESLIYTLFSLHRNSADRVDRVFINDDGSGDDVVRHYRDPDLHARLAPWTINVRINTRPTGYARQIYTERSPATLRDRPLRRIRARQLTELVKRLLRMASFPEDDVRYQWAVNATDKPYLFVIHDDVRFSGDVVDLYLRTLMQTPRCAIVGDLGQCWACGFKAVCSPSLIMAGKRPDPHWPLTPISNKAFPRHYGRSCRINEWCCLLDVAVARDFATRGIYFGNHQDRGDVGAFWFDRVLRAGYGFADPLADGDRGRFYQHGWQGHSGHDVWRNKVAYRAGEVRDLLAAEFDFRLASDPTGS